MFNSGSIKSKSSFHILSTSCPPLAVHPTFFFFWRDGYFDKRRLGRYMTAGVCADLMLSRSRAGHPDPRGPALTQQWHFTVRRDTQLSPDLQMQHPGLMWSDRPLVLIGGGGGAWKRSSVSLQCVCVWGIIWRNSDLQLLLSISHRVLQHHFSAGYQM